MNPIPPIVESHFNLNQLVYIEFIYSPITDEILASVCGRNPPADITSYSNEVNDSKFNSNFKINNRLHFVRYRSCSNRAVEFITGKDSASNSTQVSKVKLEIRQLNS